MMLGLAGIWRKSVTCRAPSNLGGAHHAAVCDCRELGYSWQGMTCVHHVVPIDIGMTAESRASGLIPYIITRIPFINQSQLVPSYSG